MAYNWYIRIYNYGKCLNLRKYVGTTNEYKYAVKKKKKKRAGN